MSEEGQWRECRRESRAKHLGKGKGLSEVLPNTLAYLRGPKRQINQGLTVSRPPYLRALSDSCSTGRRKVEVAWTGVVAGMKGHGEMHVSIKENGQNFTMHVKTREMEILGTDWWTRQSQEPNSSPSDVFLSAFQTVLSSNQRPSDCDVWSSQMQRSCAWDSDGQLPREGPPPNHTVTRQILPRGLTKKQGLGLSRDPPGRLGSQFYRFSKKGRVHRAGLLAKGVPCRIFFFFPCLPVEDYR